jgi:hypothetical protein
MVEVEYHRIDFATVDARVIQEVCKQQRAVGDAVPRHARDLAAYVLVAICEVVQVSVRGLADTTVALSSSLRHVSEGELRLGLGLAAHVAGEHVSTSVGTEGPPPRAWTFAR